MDELDELDHAAQARVGTCINDKWEVDAVVGVGGMATVYSATHRNGSRVALKVLHRFLSLDETTRQRFLREGYVANTVPHEGVVHVIDDAIMDDGSVFLVMELLDGETVDARAKRMGGRLPLSDTVSVVDGLLDVLGAAHGAGVVHRDIKPENIFFTNDRKVKVLDFGIARLRTGKHAVKTVTNGDTLLGTPAFMPPEQALGKLEQVDAQSDLWAVGATMFTLLTGELVHEGDTANEILIAAAIQPARLLSAVWPEVPSQIAEVVDRALAFDKTSRWTSARAMQHALRRAVDPNPVSRPPPVEFGAPLAILPEVDPSPSSSQRLPPLPPSSRRRAGAPASGNAAGAGSSGQTLVLQTPQSFPSLEAVAASGRAAQATQGEPPPSSDPRTHDGPLQFQTLSGVRPMVVDRAASKRPVATVVAVFLGAVALVSAVALFAVTSRFSRAPGRAVGDAPPRADEPVPGGAHPHDGAAAQAARAAEAQSAEDPDSVVELPDSPPSGAASAHGGAGKRKPPKSLLDRRK